MDTDTAFFLLVDNNRRAFLTMVMNPQNRRQRFGWAADIKDACPFHTHFAAHTAAIEAGGDISILAIQVKEVERLFG